MSGAAVVVVVVGYAPACAGDASVGTGGGGGGGGGGLLRGAPVRLGNQTGGSGFGTGVGDVGCGVPACAGDARVGGGSGDGDLRAPVGVVGNARLRFQGLSTEASDIGTPVGEAAAGTAAAGAAAAALAAASAARWASAISVNGSMAPARGGGARTAHAQGDGFVPR